MARAVEARIRGRFVELCPFEEQLITDTYLGWLNDKDLMRYSRQRLEHHTRESSMAYLRSFEDSSNKFWSIHRRADRLHIGTMTAYVDIVDGVADIGILVGHPAARGGGFGREAWGLAMDYLFRVEKVRKVTGGTSAPNVAMVRIFLHWQMKLEGIRREQEVFDGCPTDVLWFGMLSDEWGRSHPRPIAEFAATGDRDGRT